MVGEGRLEWRRSALDLPLALVIALVIVQVALGNRPFATWALAPALNPLDVPARLPSAFLTLGTVAPAHTARSLLVLLTWLGYLAIRAMTREPPQHRIPVSEVLEQRFGLDATRRHQLTRR